jgi:hypothetical protein
MPNFKEFSAFNDLPLSNEANVDLLLENFDREGGQLFETGRIS